MNVQSRQDEYSELTRPIQPTQKAEPTELNEHTRHIAPSQLTESTASEVHSHFSFQAKI